MGKAEKKTQPWAHTGPYQLFWKRKYPKLDENFSKNNWHR